MKITNWCLGGEEIDHPKDTTINKMLEDLIEDQPGLKGQPALFNVGNDRTVTYNELNETANSLARMLLRKIKKNSLTPNPDGDYIVALRFLPGEELVTTILAIFKAGLAYVPIAPNWPEGRIQHIIDDAAPVMLITNVKADILYKAQRNLSVDKSREIFQYGDLVDEGRDSNTSVKNIPSNQTLNSSLKGDKLYAVLYTSGSTGSPKGVRHLHRAALNRFHWEWRAFPYEEDEVCIFKTTLTFVDSVTEIFSPLLSGKKLVIVPTKVTQNVEKFVEVLELYKIGRVIVVTSLVRSILAFLSLNNFKKKRLLCVKYWQCSAETVTKDVLLSFFDYFQSGQQICNFYGSTEMMDVTFETFTNATDVMSVLKDDKVPIGIPVDNTKAYVLDENLEPVGEGCVGSLYVTGRNLGDGYVGTKKGSFMINHIYRTDTTEIDAQLSPRKEGIPNNYGVLYKTGDFAAIHQGRLYYEGRLDAQIKVRGHRVDLAEIEKAVYEVDGVSKAIVLCFKPGEPQQKVLCYYTVKTGVLLPENKIEQNLTALLPCYMMPRLFKLSAMPLLVNGKTDRQNLLTKYEEETLNCTTFNFTEADLEGHGVPNNRFPVAKIVLESVASIVQNASYKPTLSDNFFTIGGDSINMVMTIAKINDHGYHITVTDFVTSANLADTVAAVSTEPQVDDLSRAWQRLQERNEYLSVELEEGHKDVVLDMVSRSFAEKGDLTTLADVSYDDLLEQLQILWEALLEANLSIVITNQSGDLIGACLNFDARSEEAAPLCACSAFSRNMTPEEQQQEIENRLRQRGGVEGEVPMTVVQFLDAIEEPLKDEHIPDERGKFIYTSLLGTAKHLTTAENVQVAIFMEQENIRLGQLKGFQGIFTTNANRLTQLISRSLDYEILSTIQVNQYEDANGARPFSTAPDDLVTEVAIKRF